MINDILTNFSECHLFHTHKKDKQSIKCVILYNQIIKINQKSKKENSNNLNKVNV